MISAGMQDFCSYESQLLLGVQTGNRPDGGVQGKGERYMQSRFTCKTMWAWHDPISPHLAVAREGAAVSDSLVLESVQGLLVALSKGENSVPREDASGDRTEKWAILETAGGVASPGPSGTLQCDLYRYILDLVVLSCWWLCMLIALNSTTVYLSPNACPWISSFFKGLGFRV